MIICLDIGGSAIKSATATGPEDVALRERIATPLDDFDAFVAAIAGSITRLDAPAEAPAAIAIAGIVDPADGRITCANIPCIHGRTLAADLAARLARPVRVANDADCFALAEAMAGAGRGHRVVFGAILGTGVGGGMVIDGRILEGAGGFSGEWGHGPITATSVGTPPVAIPRFACGCGQTGCLDTLGGARGLERLHDYLHGRHDPSTEIIAAWQQGDPAAGRTLDCYLDLLADPLALVANVTGAGIIPVGGGMANVTALVARLDLAVRRRILRRTTEPLVVPGALKVEPGLVGAAILALAAPR